MKIKCIKLDGYRNLHKVVLKPNDFCSLIGLNNYGKSNLLHAIVYGISFLKVSNTEKEKMMKCISDIPINKKLYKLNFFMELELSFTEKESKEFAEIKYSFSHSWIKKDKAGNPVSKILSESLQIKPRGISKKYEQFIKREDQKALYKSSPTSRCDTKIKIQSTELVANKLRAFDNLPYLKELNCLQNIDFQIERNFDANFAYINPMPIIMKDVSGLESISEDDLPRALAFLKNEQNEKYKLIIDAFLQLFPSIQELKINTFKVDVKKGPIFPKDVPFVLCDETYKLTVIDKNLNQQVDFQMLSDGAKRILVVLTMVVIASLRGFLAFAIEEPENSIHPALLQKLLRLLDALRGEMQIFFTSHSPYLVQFVNLEDIYFGIPNNDEVAMFGNIASKAKRNKLIKEAANDDTTLGEYCFNMLLDMHSNPDLIKDLFAKEVADE